MAPRGWTTVPKPFSFLLPAQSLVAGVAIYSTNFVFGIGTIPFILAVVATGMHFLLGLYFCFTLHRVGLHHLFVVPTTLLLGGGVWAGAVYFFAKVVDALLRTKVSYPAGTNINAKPTDLKTWAYIGCGVTGFNILLDFIMVIMFGTMGAPKNTTYAPPTVETPYQQQPYLTTPMNGYTSPTSPYSSDEYKSSPHTEAKSPEMSPGYHSPPSTVSYFPSPAPTQQIAYNGPNRVQAIRRVCALQAFDGHWDYSPELAGIVRSWSRHEVGAHPRDVTAATHACLSGLCGQVWNAQRTGQEQVFFSQEEIADLRTMNGDLRWTRNAMERAAEWLEGYQH